MLINDISFRSVQKKSFQVEQKIFIGTTFVQLFEEIHCLTIIPHSREKLSTPSHFLLLRIQDYFNLRMQRGSIMSIATKIRCRSERTCWNLEQAQRSVNHKVNFERYM